MGLLLVSMEGRGLGFGFDRGVCDGHGLWEGGGVVRDGTWNI